MKKLKTIFSPRKLIVWFFLIILAITVPEITRPAMSQTEAIVTAFCLDRVEENIQATAIVLAPSKERTAQYNSFSGTGKTVSEAVENISLSLGKSMGFAQCEIMAFGDNISDYGIISSLDFMSRTRKVGRNAMLINFGGDIEDFSQAIISLSAEKSLDLEDVLSFDKRYILSQDSNIHSFYKGYFSNISLGIMPKVKIVNNKQENAIEISKQNQSSSSNQASSQSNSSKSYLLNDSTISIFKDGKKQIEMPPELVKKLNIFLNSSGKGTIKVENVSDNLYNDSDVVLNITSKNVKLTPKFVNNKPIYNIEISISGLVDEVDEENPTKKFLRRNKDFMSDELIEKTKETVKKDAHDVINFCVNNNIDLIQAYKHFYKLKHKQFLKYYDLTKEKYLSGIKYNVSVKVSSSY